jgi:hypothetical protein
MKKKIKIINVPEKELDMFAKHGVKTIVAGSKRINLVKRKKKKVLTDEEHDKMLDNNMFNFIQKGI